MKATKLILAAALITGLASFSYAGIGAQYWTQQGRKADTQKANVSTPADSTQDAMNCSTCACCGGVK